MGLCGLMASPAAPDSKGGPDRGLSAGVWFGHSPRPLAPGDRDAFLRSVAAELAQYPDELGPGVVHCLAREVQRRYLNPPSFVGCSAPRFGRTR